jgi:hypothetical protein
MKTLSALVMTVALLAGTGAPAAASSCTEEYAACLNRSSGFIAPLRLIADFVCFDDYTACVYWAMLRG